MPCSEIVDRSRNLLKRFFGYDNFRYPQQQIIEHTMEGRHSLVIMPTGSGKSLCFQIPALLIAGGCVPKPVHPPARTDGRSSAVANTGGETVGDTVQAVAKDRLSVPSAAGPRPPVTLVLSPLIALMKDQVDALQARGVAATFINSSLSRGEREKRYAALARGQYVLLYVTPERFRKQEFLNVLAQRTVQLLAVDEAHCISEWGHDFRPDYTRVAEFRSLLGSPLTMALTATATPDVQKDIAVQLGLDAGEITLFHQGIDRPNLQLRVEEVWDQEEKLAAMTATFTRWLNQDSTGSGIVYFTLIRTLMEFSELLQAQGIDHLCYHGDLDRDSRRRVQERFMSGHCRLVLATNAFGMGVDKEDIRFVVHAEIPGSLESYYQEIGRAGRDGQASECTLLYDERDLNTQMEFIRWSNPDAEFSERVFHLLEHNEEQIRAFGIDWLRERLCDRRRHDRRVETVLALLQRYGLIKDENDLSDVRVTGKLPREMTDENSRAEKLLRDQKKLYALVQYIRSEDRELFLRQYFGIPNA